MEPHESIQEMHIVSELVNPGKKIIGKKIVGKSLRSVPRDWKTKVSTIKEAKNLKNFDFDKFIGLLIAHKRKIKQLEVEDSGIKRQFFTLNQ